MKRKDKYELQNAAVAEIGIANNEAKRTRRDRKIYERLACRYRGGVQREDDLLEAIDMAHDESRRATINAIFDAGREICVTHSEDVLGNLR